MVPVHFLVAINAGQADIGADVELPLLVEEGHDVLLDDMSSRTALFIRLLSPNNFLNFLDVLQHLDSSSPIRILSRLHQPSISLPRSKPMLQLFSFLLLFVFLDDVGPPLIFFLKLPEFFISDISDMKGHGYVLKGVYFLNLVIIFEVHKESLLIGYVPVVGDMIMHLDIVRTVLEEL